MSPLTVEVLIDYQNIHLTGHGKFAPSRQARHLTLIHPLTFRLNSCSLGSSLLAQLTCRRS